MSFEEEFDSIIRRKAEEEKYPFNQDNWEKASALLDADRKADRVARVKQFLLPGTLIVVTGAIGFIAYSFFNGSHDSGLALKNPSQQETGALRTSSIQEETSPVTISSEQNAIQAQPLQSATQVQPSEVAETMNQGGSSPAMPKGEKAIVFNSEKTSFSSEDFAGKSEQSNYDHAGTGTTSSEGGNKKNESNNSDSAINSSATMVGSSDQEQHNAVSTEPESKEEMLAMQSGAPVQESQPELLSADELLTVQANLPFEFLNPDLRPSPFVLLNRYEDDYYKPNKVHKSNYFNVEAGGTYLAGWSTQHGQDGKGLNWYGGLNYGRYLSNKIDMSIGLQIYNIANIKQPFYLVASKEYSFGSDNIYTRVTSNQLFYVAVPLKVNYVLNSANSIGIGINAAYLISSQNSISKYYLLDNEEKTIDASGSNNKGIYKGTKRTNLMLTAQYKTQLSQRFGLNLEFNYGLTDIFDNTGNIKNSEKPMGVRVGLIYTLFDK